MKSCLVNAVVLCLLTAALLLAGCSPHRIPLQPLDGQSVEQMHRDADYCTDVASVYPPGWAKSAADVITLGTLGTSVGLGAAGDARALGVGVAGLGMELTSDSTPANRESVYLHCMHEKGYE
jgi:hypothetical protein